MSQPDAYLEARLHRRRQVQDMMTAAVVTVDRLTPYKEIVRLLAEQPSRSAPRLDAAFFVSRGAALLLSIQA